MAHTSIQTATNLYKFQKLIKIEHLRVKHQAFDEFSFCLRRFIRSLNEQAEEDYWKEPIRKLKRYRFDMSAAPLGFGNALVFAPEVLNKLKGHFASCAMLYSGFSAEVDWLLNALNALLSDDENPLLDEIKNLLATHQEITVVLKESRHIPVFEDVLKKNNLSGVVKVVSESQLRRSDVLHRVIVSVGASHWYSDYIFRAPRAERIFILRFAWIKDYNHAAEPVFSGWKATRKAIGAKKTRYETLNDSHETETVTVKSSDEKNWLDDDELIPRLNLSEVAQKFSRSKTNEDDETEDALAKLFQLEGRRGVFLNAEEGSTTLVIDLEEDDDSRVKRIPTKDILSGMFILIRADEGEGTDYIIPVADKILKRDATTLRKVQKQLKQSLRDKVKTLGKQDTISQLRQYGSIRANENNLRNWMSDRNIRTEDERDFYAIMRLLNLDEIQSQKCWLWMTQIDRAHRKAGRVVRKQLLNQVCNTDLNELEQLGEMKFELSELGGKPLLALRIVRVADSLTSVSISHINKLFDLEEDSWQE